MRMLPYEIVDVFTQRPFAGNPLAVVFGADGLASAQLQALAREFQLSETVFVLPATAPQATYRARIFTPEREIPFAGHPSVGVAVTQLRRGLLAAGTVWQECGAGVLPIEVSADGYAMVTGAPAHVEAALDPVPVLAAAGLSPEDGAGLPPPRIAGCGLDFVFQPVRSGALARAFVRAPLSGGEDVCVFSWDGEAALTRSRVFVPSVGVSEDPATGSAALALGAWLVASGLLPGDATSSYVIHQGIEMGRPSILECTVSAAGGVVTRTTVRGAVVAIARGEIMVPPG